MSRYTRTEQTAALQDIYQRAVASGAIGLRTAARRIVGVDGAKFKNADNLASARKLKGRTFGSVYGELRRIQATANGVTL